MIKQEILELLQHSGQETVFSFVAEYAAEDKRFYEKIKEALLSDEDEEEEDEEEFDMDYYRELAEDCYDFDRHRRRGYDYYEFREAAYRAASGLNEVLDDAASLSQQGQNSAAAGMAMSVAEIIPQNAENVDDSDGELGDTFNKAIKLLCDIVNKVTASSFTKQEVYKWSKNEASKPVYSDYGHDEIQTIYELCCEKLGDTDEVLADIDSQINATSNEYRRSKAVLWKIRFMQSRNLDTGEVYDDSVEWGVNKKY